MPTLLPSLALLQHIRLVRGHPVVLQDDLARLYDTHRNQVADHARRFPGDLCFPLETPELAWVDDSPGDDQERIYGFTEHGALALAYALNSPAAVAMSVHVVRAFVASRCAGGARRIERLPPVP